jgi:hydroxymethylpyrimidine pyrophosphatase-like HAD family hydrolase
VQPIDALPSEIACRLSGVCFDVDDTLTRHGVLELSAYAALFELRQAGLKLIAVTGRPLGFAEVLARMWPIDAAVGENGAGFMARTGAHTRVEYWDDEGARRMQAEQLARIRARVARELPELCISSDGWARRCDLAFDVGEEVQVPRARVDQLVAIIEAEGARASVSSVHAHAQLGDHDKARGAARAAALLWRLGAEEVRERFLFVGDSGNDAAAFAWFAHSAGVANVAKYLDRLPVAPGFVANAECGAGFAEIVRVLLAKRAQTP